MNAMTMLMDDITTKFWLTWNNNPADIGNIAKALDEDRAAIRKYTFFTSVGQETLATVRRLQMPIWLPMDEYSAMEVKKAVAERLVFVGYRFYNDICKAAADEKANAKIGIGFGKFRRLAVLIAGVLGEITDQEQLFDLLDYYTDGEQQNVIEAMVQISRRVEKLTNAKILAQSGDVDDIELMEKLDEGDRIAVDAIKAQVRATLDMLATTGYHAATAEKRKESLTSLYMQGDDNPFAQKAHLIATGRKYKAKGKKTEPEAESKEDAASETVDVETIDVDNMSAEALANVINESIVTPVAESTTEVADSAARGSLQPSSQQPSHKAKIVENDYPQAMEYNPSRVVATESIHEYKERIRAIANPTQAADPSADCLQPATKPAEGTRDCSEKENKAGGTPDRLEAIAAEIIRSFEERRKAPASGSKDIGLAAALLTDEFYGSPERDISEISAMDFDARVESFRRMSDDHVASITQWVDVYSEFQTHGAGILSDAVMQRIVRLQELMGIVNALRVGPMADTPAVEALRAFYARVALESMATLEANGPTANPDNKGKERIEKLDGAIKLIQSFVAEFPKKELGDDFPTVVPANIAAIAVRIIEEGRSWPAICRYIVKEERCRKLYGRMNNGVYFVPCYDSEADFEKQFRVALPLVAQAVPYIPKKRKRKARA